MKQQILFELRKEEPKLRLVLAILALGMGLDAPGITRIIHCRPPKLHLRNIFRSLAEQEERVRKLR
ncbi:Hypothetical predicted protein, partial [Mytilus galloprovincialis]